MKKPKILYIGNDLAVSSKYNSAMQTLYELLSEEGYEVIKSSAKKNTVFRLLDMITTIIKNKNVDYVLIDTFSTTAFYYALITSQLLRFFKIKYIPILHGGNLPNRLKSSPKMCDMIFKNAYKNIAPSNYLKSEFEQHNFRVDYIPNTLPISNYSFKKRRILQPKLLWVRAFKALYNPLMAINVVAILKEMYPNIKLCMVGPERDETLQQAKELIVKKKLEKAIEITGVLPKEQWHQKSKDFDIFINTTNVDNTPVSVIEAMALGLPVISTNVGGLPFLINHKKDGILVPKNDAQKMADEIKKLIENNNLMIAENARKKAESFDGEINKIKWIKILA